MKHKGILILVIVIAVLAILYFATRPKTIIAPTVPASSTSGLLGQLGSAIGAFVNAQG